MADLDFKLLFRLLLYVFLPVLVAVVVMWIILTVYYKSKRNDPTKNYARKGTIMSLMMSSVITLLLFVINVLFSINFVNAMTTNNLVKENQAIYYVVLFSPVLSFICLLFYLINMFKALSKKSENAYNDIISESILNEEVQDIDNNVDDKKIELEEVNNDDDTIEVL